MKLINVYTMAVTSRFQLLAQRTCRDSTEIYFLMIIMVLRAPYWCTYAQTTAGSASAPTDMPRHRSKLELVVTVQLQSFKPYNNPNFTF